MGNQSPGHRRALLLPAGYLIRVLSQDIRDLQLFGDRGQAPAHFGIGLAGQNQRQKNVILHREGIEQVKILEHKAQMLPPESGQLLVLDAHNVPSV